MPAYMYPAGGDYPAYADGPAYAMTRGAAICLLAGERDILYTV